VGLENRLSEVLKAVEGKLLDNPSVGIDTNAVNTYINLVHAQHSINRSEESNSKRMIDIENRIRKLEEHGV